MTVDDITGASIPEPNSGCWLWMRNINSYGYGNLYGRNQAGKAVNYAAHRVSYELHCGPIPQGMVVCHRCDVRSCVNPAHLFVGTQGDNVRDCIQKGRKAPLRPFSCGEDGINAKLTEGDVRAIRHARASGRTLVSIAAEFGVDHTSVSLIARRKTWAHVA